MSTPALPTPAALQYAAVDKLVLRTTIIRPELWSLWSAIKTDTSDLLNCVERLEHAIYVLRKARDYNTRTQGRYLNAMARTWLCRAYVQYVTACHRLDRIARTARRKLHKIRYYIARNEIHTHPIQPLSLDEYDRMYMSVNHSEMGGYAYMRHYAQEQIGIEFTLTPPFDMKPFNIGLSGRIKSDYAEQYLTIDAEFKSWVVGSACASLLGETFVIVAKNGPCLYYPVPIFRETYTQKTPPPHTAAGAASQPHP